MSDLASASFDFRPGQYVATGHHGSDDGLFVEFRHQAVHMEFKSREAGRPIFDDKVFVRIMVPGDKTKTVDREAKLEDDQSGPSDATRFPRQWAAFKADQEQAGEGVPLSEFPQLTTSQVAELKALHIYTVEQLASMADSALTWLGARELRDRARNWLQKAEGGAVEARLQTQLEQRDAQIEVLQQQLAALTEQVKADSAKKGK